MSKNASRGGAMKGWAALATLAMAVGCSSSGTGDGGTTTGGTGGALTVTITNFAFSPPALTVPPGATVTFVNAGSSPHTATSQAAPDMFVNGQADGGFTFDTATIAVGASATVTVPATIASGTVQPFFCKIHTSMMMPPNPTLIIQQ
jgi:plastocyanin